MAKITFIYPDYESIGIQYLMSICAASGHDVNFVYYEAEDPYLGITKKALSYDKVVDEICQLDPDIVAFSCVTENFRYQLHCAESLKSRRQDIFTIFGGVHPTAVPEKTLQHPCVDAVAIGEAECSLINFLEESDIPAGFTFPSYAVAGIMFKNNGQIFGEASEGPLPDLDQLPMPNKEPFFDLLRDSLNEYRIITSRGCPCHCSFCFNSVIEKARGKNIIRQRSVSNVIEELLYAKKTYSIKHVIFWDDSFTTNKTWIKDFCNRYRMEINLPFACVANPRYIDEDIAESLASAGCVNVELGVQSLSETLCLQVLDRVNDNAKTGNVICALKEHGIIVQIDHMLGIPGDTIEKQEEGIRFYNTYRPNFVSIYWLTYYPKAPILEIALKQGLIRVEDLDSIDRGERLRNSNLLDGGSLKDPRPYYAVRFLINWLPLLPKSVVEILLKTRIYRIFKIKNFYVSIALPRVILSLINRRDFRARSHILRFFDKLVIKSRFMRLFRKLFAFRTY